MARNDVYLYTNATSVANAVVTSQTVTTAASFPDLVLGDSPTYNFYFTDGTASWPSFAGNASYSVEWTLGTAGSDDSVILAHQTVATVITGGWSMVLPLNTGAILAQLNAARVSQAYPVVQLWQQVRVTDPSGYKTTYANIRTNLRLRTAPSGQVLPDDPLPSGYQSVIASQAGRLAGPSNFFAQSKLDIAAADGVLAVDSIAELRTLSDTYADGSVVIVRGYYAAGDGGGGTFVYDEDLATADNGGTIIEPTGGAGAWVRQYSGAISVKWFGAKGDGVTSDQLRIQSALDFVESDGGGVLLLDQGTYLLSRQANPDAPSDYAGIFIRSGVSFVGQGRGVSILKIPSGVDGNPAYDVATVLASEALPVSISGITLDGNRQGNPGWTIVGNATYALSIFADHAQAFSCEFKNSFNGAGCPASAGNVVFDRCTSTGNGKKGFYCGRVDRVQFISCNAYDNETDTGFGLDQGIREASVIGCVAYNNGGPGIYFGDTSGTAATESRNCTLTGNLLSDNTDAGIYIDTVNYTGADLLCSLVVSGNVCVRNNRGIQARNSRAVSISGNNVEQNSLQGIYIEGCEDFSVCGNIVIDNCANFSGGAPQAGIYILSGSSAITTSTNIIALGNIIKDSRATVLQKNGIDLNSTGSVISGNVIVAEIGNFGIRDRQTGNKIFANQSAQAVALQTISGSRGGNAAIASLASAGAVLGMWIDGTS